MRNTHKLNSNPETSVQERDPVRSAVAVAVAVAIPTAVITTRALVSTLLATHAELVEALLLARVEVVAPEACVVKSARRAIRARAAAQCPILLGTLLVVEA